MDMNVILATGVPELDEAIEQRIKKINFVGSALYKEAVVEITERKQPDLDAIILSELLEGVMTTRELVLKLRTRFPDTRIIYIMKEESAKEKSFLYQWSVFDILPSKFGVSELETALFNPKEFKDVAREMEELKDYQKPSD
jgi:CheY-like chemotaxis protein